MLHRVRLAGVTFGGRNIPPRGGGADEHQTSGGAGLPHHVEEIADGVRRIGLLVAILWIGERLLDLDSLPVGAEFIGQDNWQRGLDPVPHLGAMRDDRNRSVGGDGHPQTRLKRCGRCFPFRGPERFGNQSDAEHEYTGGEGALKKSAAGDILDELHTVSLAAWCLATLWMAARIRW